jgi:3-oxoacyl-[acyl-carrier-protein] synthase-3
MSRIVATGAYLPGNIVDNSFFSLSSDPKSGAPITKLMTGLNERRHATESETGLFMGLEASRLALSRSGYRPENVDLVIGMIQPNQYLYPEDLFLLAKEAGCFNAIVIPINTACSSFITALNIANTLIGAGSKRNALVLTAANWVRKGLDKSADYSFAGDGAGAVVLDNQGESMLAVEEDCDVRVFDTMRMKSPVFTSKEEYFEITADPDIDMVAEQVEKPIDVAKRLLAENEDLVPDWFIAHQAGVAMLDLWRRQLKLPKKRVIHTFDKYANMSVANIPVTLDHYVSAGVINRGDMLLLFAPAAGAHYIAVLWRY